MDHSIAHCQMYGRDGREREREGEREGGRERERERERVIFSGCRWKM